MISIPRVIRITSMESKMDITKNPNSSLLIMAQTMLIEGLDKKGLSEFGWWSCDIAELEHGAMCAIERNDTTAFITYLLMLQHRGHSIPGMFKAVFNSKKMELAMCQEAISDLQASNNEKIGRINELTTSNNDLTNKLSESQDEVTNLKSGQRYSDTRIVNMQKEIDALVVDIGQTSVLAMKGVDVRIQELINGNRDKIKTLEKQHEADIATMGEQRKEIDYLRARLARLTKLPDSIAEIRPGDTVNCRCKAVSMSELLTDAMKPTLLAEFLAENLHEWPKGVVAFGPMTTFNGMVGRPDLTDLVMTPHEWKSLRNKANGSEDEESAEDGDGGEDPIHVEVEVATGKSTMRFYGTPEQVKAAMAEMGVTTK